MKNKKENVKNYESRRNGERYVGIIEKVIKFYYMHHIYIY